MEGFLSARGAARDGDIQPVKTFVNETPGEPSKDQFGEIEDFDFLPGRRGDYDFGDPWPEERVRMMAADRQASGGEHYWYVVRAFGPFGHSRLVSYGRCNSTLELEQLLQEHGVVTANAMVDSGFKASEVYRFCQSTGWKPFKGDDAEFFAVKDMATVSGAA